MSKSASVLVSSPDPVWQPKSVSLPSVCVSSPDPIPVLPELQLHRDRGAVRRAALGRGRAAGQPPPEGDQQGNPGAPEGEVLRDTLR